MVYICSIYYIQLILRATDNNNKWKIKMKGDNYRGGLEFQKGKKQGVVTQ